MPARSVLIVEDTPSSVQMICRAIGTDYVVYTASTGEDGIVLARRHRPDVVLLDVMLPAMDGYAVCRHMRQDPVLADIPVVMISGLDDRESRLLGLQAGADDFIAKPIDPLELRVRLKNITTMNRFRKSLEAQERFRLVFMASPDPVVLASRRTGAVLLANEAAQQQLDLSQGLWQAVYADDRAGIAEQLGTGLPGHPLSLPVRMIGRDGAIFASDWTATTTHWDDEPAVVIALRNVTARLTMEARQRQAERVSASIQATASQAHEFGNYLMAIRVGLDLARRTVSRDHPAFELLDEVDRQIDHAEGTVRQMKDLSKGAHRVDLMLIDVGAFVQDLHRTLQHMLGGRTVSIVVGPPGHHILADPLQLRQVLFNLVANARDAIGDAGTVAIAVGYRPPTETETGRVTLAVKDDGCGMPPEVQARMFEPYFTTKEGRGGSGIGLATVHGIVELQRGRIQVNSAPGAGTVVTIEWPEDGIGVPTRPERSKTCQYVL